MATTTLVMTVRVPDTPDVTMVPLKVSLPLAAAAVGPATVAEMASAIAAASSAPRWQMRILADRVIYRGLRYASSRPAGSDRQCPAVRAEQAQDQAFTQV